MRQDPDTFYCLSLLEEMGICIVPASGFGQKKGRFGFRTTFLPPEDQLLDAIQGFAKHHQIFCDRYTEIEARSNTRENEPVILLPDRKEGMKFKSGCLPFYVNFLKL